jgi:hypothetical protein
MSIARGKSLWKQPSRPRAKTYDNISRGDKGNEDAKEGVDARSCVESSSSRLGHSSFQVAADLSSRKSTFF